MGVTACTQSSLPGGSDCLDTYAGYPRWLFTVRWHLGLVLESGQSCDSKTKCRMTRALYYSRKQGEADLCRKRECRKLMHGAARRVERRWQEEGQPCQKE